MLDFLGVAVKAGFGLAAISAATFWSIHKDFIQANIFSEMSADQTLTAFQWSSAIAGILFFFTILFSFLSKSNGKTISSDNGGISIDNSGFFNSFKIFKKKGNK